MSKPDDVVNLNLIEVKGGKSCCPFLFGVLDSRNAKTSKPERGRICFV